MLSFVFNHESAIVQQTPHLLASTSSTVNMAVADKECA